MQASMKCQLKPLSLCITFTSHLRTWRVDDDERKFREAEGKKEKMRKIRPRLCQSYDSLKHDTF